MATDGPALDPPAIDPPAIDPPGQTEADVRRERNVAPEHHGSLFALALGSVGVVYGDIGTSPLYALRESLHAAAADGVTRAEVLGVVSLLLWALIIIVSLKYVLFLLRCDNNGEGGILSLVALTQTARGRRTPVIFVLGIAGASLFFGDALITPAISVLSAVEGLELVTPAFTPYVLPIALAILISLFAVQFRGTGSISMWFGPITALWFIVMGVAGAVHIADDPGIVAAFNPVHGLTFLFSHGLVGFIVLGAVFLAVTGGEALYADLGHFGRKPIQLAWFCLIFPCLALNYLGQGALVLAHPEAIENPFFLLVPGWATLPLVILATLATVIASQAVITGAFSMTRQAVQLGLLPRFVIRHTSETHGGQIYLPVVNYLLLGGVIFLVIMFGSSKDLASAYGIAVTATMLVETALTLILLIYGWRWPVGLAFALATPILVVEFAFFSANVLKIPEGGWLPVLFAAVLMFLMWTWAKGTRELFERARREVIPLREFVAAIERGSVARARGTAIFLTSDPEATPPALLHNIKHNGVLHETVVVLTIQTPSTPRVAHRDRIEIEKITERFVRIKIRFGYMETPDVSWALKLCAEKGMKFDMMRTSFFVGRRKLVADSRVGMPLWQDRTYIMLSRFAADPSDFYHLPHERVVEIGVRHVV